MTTKHPSEIGLRERKKLATRAALSEAALRLTIERGFDHVRVEDIAAAADVAPRTFNNYFSSKEEAIVAVGRVQLEMLQAALRTRPPGEPLWKALGHAVGVLFPADPDATWVAQARLLRAEPALLAERLKSDALIERAMAREIAEWTGTDPDRDMYPRLAAAVVVAAVHAAFDFWLDNPAPALPATLTGAVDQVAAGLPAPTNDRGLR